MRGILFFFVEPIIYSTFHSLPHPERMTQTKLDSEHRRDDQCVRIREKARSLYKKRKIRIDNHTLIDCITRLCKS